MLGICEDWAARNGMSFNLSKCGVVGLRPDEPDLLLDGQPIPRVASYVYLGIPFGSRGILWQAHLDRRLSAAKNAMHALRASCSRYGWNPALRLGLYKVYVRATLEYGAPLLWTWASANYTLECSGQMRRSLDHFHDKALRWCLQLNWSFTGTIVTRSICGSEAFTRRFRNLSTLFAGHLRGMASTNPLKWPVWTLLRANYGSLISASWITHRLLTNSDLAAMDDRIRLRAQRMRKPPPSTLADWKKACRSLQRKDCASDLVTGPRSAAVY